MTHRMKGCKIQGGICPNQNQTKIDSKRMKRRMRVKLTSKQKLKIASALVSGGGNDLSCCDEINKADVVSKVGLRSRTQMPG